MILFALLYSYFVSHTYIRVETTYVLIGTQSRAGSLGDTMLIGYARTSTVDQAAGFEAQIVELEAYGCERTYQEQVSAVASRHELETAIDMLRTGDKLVVTKLDRLARNVP